MKSLRRSVQRLERMGPSALIPLLSAAAAGVLAAAAYFYMATAATPEQPTEAASPTVSALSEGENSRR